ncbi:MAG: MBL fold metallo-hydrolase [Thermoanaerobaculia bacterium]
MNRLGKPFALLATCVALAAALLVATRVSAATYRMEPLADGVWAMVWTLESGDVSDSNVLIVINEGDVVVVDAGILPSSARAAVGEIRKLTDLPVSTVINTHWHSDHHYGNAVYRSEYPGVEFVQHEQTREMVLAHDVPVLPKNLRERYPQEIERLRGILASGKRSNGEPLPEGMRASVERTVDVYRKFLDEMTDTPIVPGTMTVRDGLVLHRGEREIQVRFLGRGNTPGDLVVVLPRERIVATGDLVVSPTPFAFSSYLSEWPATLRSLRSIDAATILPGHGEPMRDWGYVDSLVELLDSTWTQVKAAVDAGEDLEATVAVVDLDRFVDRFSEGDSREGFDYLYRRPAIESAWTELTTGEPAIED